MPSFYAIERKSFATVLGITADITKRQPVELHGSYSIAGSPQCNIGLVTLASGMKRVVFFDANGNQMTPRASGVCESRSDEYIDEIHMEPLEKV